MSSRDLDIELLRAAITGLVLHAAGAEAALLADAGAAASGDHGDATCWAAAPIVAHNTESKRQQVHRLAAILDGSTPRSFGEIDHHSPDYYAECASRPVAEVAADSRDVTAAFLAALRAVEDEDLLDPTRHPWLNGRQFALQLVVRGFWHPLGHVGDYYLEHERPEQALAVQRNALNEASRPGVPRMALGMAHYTLGCTQARTGAVDDALGTLAQATSLNPDLVANLVRDHDVDALREDERFSALMSGRRR